MEISQVPGLSATLNRRKTPGGGGPAPWLRHSLALNGQRFIPFLSPILDVSSGYTSHTSIQSRSSNVATAGDHGAPVSGAMASVAHRPWPSTSPRALRIDLQCISASSSSVTGAPTSLETLRKASKSIGFRRDSAKSTATNTKVLSFEKVTQPHEALTSSSSVCGQ